MRYALLIHYPQPAISTLSDDEIKAGMLAFQAYARALDDAGALRSAEVLQTIASATSVSMKAGTLHVQDGPFAECVSSTPMRQRIGSPSAHFA